MQIEVGAIVEGKITGITKYGAFVALPEGKTGMVHISEVSSSFVKEIRDYLQENQQVRVMVIGIDENGKIALSLKRAQAEFDKQNRASSAPAEYVQYSSSHQTSKKRPPQNGQPAVPQDPFEEMMSKFKADSDEKISDLKKAVDSKRSSPGFSRKNSNKY